MSDIWICSDWHLNHNRDFIWQKRGFTNVYEMNKAIIERHNSLVASDDEVYVLGDCTLGDLDMGHDLMAQMKGHLHIAIGNHSTDNRIEMYNHLWNVVEIEYAYRIKLGKWRFYATHYPCLCSNWDDGKTPGQSIINLCGHTHTTDPFHDWNKGKIFHVEMETNNCRPWKLVDIQEAIRNKYQNFILYNQ